MKHQDKLLHFLMTFFIVTTLSIINIWLGVAVAIVLSLLKEFHDMKQEGNHFCWWDLLADTLGILMAIIIYFLK